MRLHQTAAALFVTLLPFPALAVSLGALQGSAWIGQPLDVRVPVALDGADAAGSLCVQVDLRQGDAAQPDAGTGVQAVLEPGAAPDRPHLRVRSGRAIDEPVLHLRVQVGCQGASSREFVLLADPPPVLAAVPASRAEGTDAGAQAPARLVPDPAAAAAARAGTPHGSLAAVATAPGERGPRMARSAGHPPRATPVVRSTTVARPPAARAAAPAATARAEATRGRLQLDALEPLPARTAVAAAAPASAAAGAGRMTGALAAASAAGAAAGPGAGASPTLAEVARTTQLEAALAELRAQARQNQQTLAELRGELAQARDSRYSNPLVYALGLLLLMMAAALWALWHAARRLPDSPWAEATPQALIRRRREQRRARARSEADEEDTGLTPLYFPAAVSRRGQLADDDEGEADDDLLPGAADAAGGPDGTPWGRPRAAARPASARALAVDELFDVQQQAEFFSSLGQHEQAIEVLRHYLDAHPQAGALAYLELLHLYHQLEREADYERLRLQCQQAINVRLPGFHAFGAIGGRTLEHYPEVRARLQSHWPHPRTLEVIEELLLRHGDDGGEAFDLAACRELLMLHALMQEQSLAPGQAWPPLDDLLRLPRLDDAAPAPAAGAVRANTRAAPLAAAGPGAPDRLDAMPDPQRGDFQPTWPPSLDQELDMDLARMESQQIDTIPVALRRPAAPDSPPPTGPLERAAPHLAARADRPPAPPDTAANPDPGPGASARRLAEAFLR